VGDAWGRISAGKTQGIRAALRLAINPQYNLHALPVRMCVGGAWGVVIESQERGKERE